MSALVTSAPPGIPLAKQSQSTPALLILALLSTTAFQYIWLGPLPLWLILVLLGFGMTMLERSGMVRLFAVLSRIGRSVVIPWLLFIVVHTAIAISHGVDTNKALIYLLSGLLLFVMMAVWSLRARYATLIYVIGWIAMLESIVGMAQAANIDLAWHIPDAMRSIFPHASTDMSAYLDVAENAGRARGTLELVHMFNAMQGVLCAILVAVAALGTGKSESKSLHRGFVFTSMLLGVTGMILAFSRSTVLGMLAALAFLTYKRAQTQRSTAVLSFVMVIAAAAAIFIVIFLNIDQKALMRLTNLSPSKNMDRVAFAIVAWNVLKTAIVFGNPALAPSGPFALPIHSVPLRIFVDDGIVGLAFYAYVLFGVAREFWAASRHSDPRLRTIGAAGFSAFIIGLFDASTHSSGLLQSDFLQPAIFGMLIGMTIARRRVLSQVAKAE